MITLKQGIKLSAIIDKLDLKIKTKIKNEQGEFEHLSQEEVGADLIMQFVRKAYKAEQEVYNFVAEYQKCSTQEAENVDLVDFVKGLFSDEATVSFFKSAVTSSVQD
ncbi:hypothetical protein [Bacillus sp. V2I10]|uniref:hypothetical protein n=1 Tax=Bacillus sp. V2I10 TaxID=3042276 RepID=UPI0027808677|nr:hypothetical protein [Bacillus sp. V2I10]MDQ0859578.1 hypothetical protein [Bacillus sp. V2I10]